MECHDVNACLGGNDEHYVLCDDRLYRAGPFPHRLDADHASLWHEHITGGLRDRDN